MDHYQFYVNVLSMMAVTSSYGKIGFCLLLLICTFSVGVSEPCMPTSLTREEYKQSIRKGLTFVHQNVCGIHSNFANFQEFVTSHKEIDIISVSETHLKDNNDIVCIDGYDFVQKHRENGLGGGVGVFVKENITFKVRSDFTHKSLEAIWIEIFIKNSKPIIFGCCYRPPETSKYLDNNYNTYINETLTTINAENKETVIMGDFNVNYLNIKSAIHNDFRNIMTLNGFKQVVKSATRITKESSSLIDLIFVNKLSNCHSINVVSTSLGDHEMVSCTRKINYQKFQHRTIKCRDFRNYDHNILLSDAQKIDWTSLHDTNDVNIAVNYLTTELQNLFDKQAPFIEKRVKAKPSQWLNEDLKREMNKRDNLLRKARAEKSDAKWDAYKKQRNICTKVIKKAKASYHHRLLNESRISPRKFWNSIKSLFPTKNRHSSKTMGDQKSRVNSFVNFFSGIVTKIKKIAFPLTDFVWRYHQKRRLRTSSIFKFTYVSTVFVQKELRKLKRNKAAGTDNLPPNMLKDCASAIAKPIARIINLSLNTSTVPDLWKSAKINPVFKSGDYSNVENYRLISILPILSKLLERVVHNQFYEYLERNNLLNECQYGFRKNRSTKLATTLFCDTVRKHIDQGKMTGALFLDLSKAFDTIGHGILLEKLILYGVGGNEHSWFTDYLFRRPQHVEQNNIRSETKFITSGVPQGSILGPLLFIVFFNDLPDHLTYCEIFQYADDTVILYADKDIDRIEKMPNADINNNGTYCEQNELLLNLKKGKTETMLFGTSQRLSRSGRDLGITYNGTKINHVSEYVYLGNLLDTKLSLASNFERAYKKASGRVRLLANIRVNLTTEAALLIYRMMILPILTYSATVKTTFTNSQLLKLARLEIRVSKIISGNTEIKSIKETIDHHTRNLVLKCVSKKLKHETFDNYFEVQRHSKATRNNGFLLKLPKIKLEVARGSFYYGGALLFNSLNIDERKAHLK